jgi:myo-inositol-1(or 4)-monophosphatase
VYNPISEELFTAERGAGAFLNGERLRTSDFTRPTQALTAVSFPTQTKPDSPDYLAFKRCVPVCQAMRRTGSTALNLAYVAAGRFDAKICQCAHPWDVAAGVLLVLEAGGVATNADGRPFDLAIKPLLATANSELHGAFLKLLND